MKIFRKATKVGSSVGVTLSEAVLYAMGVKIGDSITFELTMGDPNVIIRKTTDEDRKEEDFEELLGIAADDETKQ